MSERSEPSGILGRGKGRRITNVYRCEIFQNVSYLKKRQCICIVLAYSSIIVSKFRKSQFRIIKRPHERIVICW